MAADAPVWFTSALAQSVDHDVVEVDGCRVAHRAWGKPGGPIVVLVHGGAAHAGWWDHVGPHLSAEHRVVAIDLSGHGDSGHRSAYSLEGWADEVMTVAAIHSDAPPVLFGHSMGGFVALTAAKLHGERLRGVAAIDSPVQEISPEARAWMQAGTRIPTGHVHADRESILARFRTIPADESSLPYVHRHLAEGSIRAVEGGWAWKFDRQIFLRSQMEPEELAAAACEVALIRGERGMATTDITEVVAARLGGHVPVTVIPDAGHHIMLDQPVALIAALQTLLGQWRNP